MMYDYGKSGARYRINKVKPRMWLVYKKVRGAWVRTQAKRAALDCGAKGRWYTHHTHPLCAQIW
jgi:hypothetical protein